MLARVTKVNAVSTCIAHHSELARFNRSPRVAKQASCFSVFESVAFKLATGSRRDFAIDLRRIAESPRFVESIRLLSRSRGELRRVAALSYRHGNGFLKLQLASHRHSKLRLHVWMPGQLAEENIHDHRWAFASYVLTGTLHSDYFVDDPHGGIVGVEYRHVARDAQGQPARKARVGSARLRRTVCSARTRGQVYMMRPSELHRICRTNANELVATLMITAPPRELHSRLIVQETIGLDPEVDPSPLRPYEVKGALQVVLEAIGRN